MTELMMTKRKGRAGEIGLFCEHEVFAEDFAAIKMDSEVKAVVTSPRSAQQLKFFWALMGKVADNCAWIDDKDTAKELVLFHARHVRYFHDQLRGTTEIRSKSISGMNGPDFLRLLRRCVHVVATQFIPGMDAGPERAEIEAMIADRGVPADAPAAAKPPKASRARKTSQEPVLPAAGGGESTEPVDRAPNTADSTGSRPAPSNEAEYLAAARGWISKQIDHEKALAYYESENQIALRAACKLSVGGNKMLRRELATHIEKLNAKATA
jgi:hypothetical protein